MQLQLAELNAFFEKIHNTDALVLTPNRRLVQFLHSQFNHYKLSKGLKAWASHPCLFLNDWLQSLWQQAG